MGGIGTSEGAAAASAAAVAALPPPKDSLPIERQMASKVRGDWVKFFVCQGGRPCTGIPSFLPSFLVSSTVFWAIMLRVE